MIPCTTGHVVTFFGKNGEEKEIYDVVAWDEPIKVPLFLVNGAKNLVRADDYAQRANYADEWGVYRGDGDDEDHTEREREKRDAA